MNFEKMKKFNFVQLKVSSIADVFYLMLLGSLSSIKHLGLGISEEAEVHVRLLGEIEGMNEEATMKQKANKNALSEMVDQSSVTCLWLLILLLSMILVMMITFA
jgi:hypothetical protein